MCKEWEELVMNHPFFLSPHQSCDIEKLVKFSESLAELVKFTLQKISFKSDKTCWKNNTDHNGGLHLRDLAHDKSFK